MKSTFAVPLAAISLTVVPLGAQTPVVISREQVIRRIAPGEASAASPKGWVGILLQGPNRQEFDSAGLRVTYFAYPSILSVDPDSPAEHAGIEPGDLLLAYDGTDVVGREFNLTRMLVPERRIAITVRRDGERKEYAVDVAPAPGNVALRRLAFDRAPLAPPEAPMPPAMRARVLRLDGGGFPVISPRGIFGASVSTVGPELARALKLERGVLVNDVPKASPAFTAGLRAGDVIMTAAAQAVVSLDDLQDLIVARLGEHSLPLLVMRDGKRVKLTVAW